MEDGISIGETLGEARGKALSILEILSEHGTVPDALIETIMNQKDIKILGTWLKLAIKTSSIHEFKEKM